MLAEESLSGGNLKDALAQLQDQVRRDPGNAKLRTFLFQLLSLTGNWERALTQLNVAGELDAGALAMVQTYREALRCEALRAEVFAGRRSPLVFGKPEQWVALLLQAARLAAEGQHAQSQEVRDQAFEFAPTTGGRIGDRAFEWIADADPRMGPMLEAIVNGRYYWIPFNRIKTVQIDPPEDLRDLVWAPAHFVWANGGETVGLIPTRYPGSEASEDGAIRLARRTEWLDSGAGIHTGLGQRMLATDIDEFPLLEIRRIDLDSPAEEADDEPDQQRLSADITLATSNG